MNSSYQQKKADIQAKISHYLPIVLNWVWKNIVVNSYRFRILETLLYIFFATTPTDVDNTDLEFYFRMAYVGLFMVLINISYWWYRDDPDYPPNFKILFNNDRTRLIGYFIGVLLMLPAILYFGIVTLVGCGAIYILWISIKLIINAFKK